MHQVNRLSSSPSPTPPLGARPTARDAMSRSNVYQMAKCASTSTTPIILIARMDRNGHAQFHLRRTDSRCRSVQAKSRHQEHGSKRFTSNLELRGFVYFHPLDFCAK